MRSFLQALARFGARLVTLVVCATCGGAIVFQVSFAFCRVVFDNATLAQALAPRDPYVGHALDFLMLGLGTGMLGLGYAHTLLAYFIFFRRIPDFWRRLPVYFTVLSFGTTVLAIFFIVILSRIEPALPVSLFLGSGLGFWMTSAIVYWRRRRATAPASVRVV